MGRILLLSLVLLSWILLTACESKTAENVEENIWVDQTCSLWEDEPSNCEYPFDDSITEGHIIVENIDN